MSSIGAIMIMSDEAVDNYGEEWANVELEVTGVYSRYGHGPAPEHLGYDEGVAPTLLYEFDVVHSGEHFPFALYEWEVEQL